VLLHHVFPVPQQLDAAGALATAFARISTQHAQILSTSLDAFAVLEDVLFKRIVLLAHDLARHRSLVAFFARSFLVFYLLPFAVC
jgi:hypothetical protein